MTSDDARTFAESLTTVDDRAKSEIFIPADQNPTQFTFYREGTPPPTNRVRQKETESGASGVAFGGSSGADGAGGKLEEGSNYGRPAVTICGIRKLVFWCIIAAVAVFLIALAVGLGVGLGFATRKPSSGLGDASVTGTAGETLPSTTLGSDSSASTVMPSSSPTPGASLECPDAHGKAYTVPGTKKDFLIACGIDYDSSRGEAVDLGQLLTVSMGECMKRCAHFSGCAACGWGFIEGDRGDALRCWLKGNLAQYHTARANWSFAILQPSTEP